MKIRFNYRAGFQNGESTNGEVSVDLEKVFSEHAAELSAIGLAEEEAHRETGFWPVNVNVAVSNADLPAFQAWLEE